MRSAVKSLGNDMRPMMLQRAITLLRRIDTRGKEAQAKVLGVRVHGLDSVTVPTYPSTANLVKRYWGVSSRCQAAG